MGQAEAALQRASSLLTSPCRACACAARAARGTCGPGGGCASARERLRANSLAHPPPAVPVPACVCARSASSTRRLWARRRLRGSARAAARRSWLQWGARWRTGTRSWCVHACVCVRVRASVCVRAYMGMCMHVGGRRAGGQVRKCMIVCVLGSAFPCRLHPTLTANAARPRATCTSNHFTSRPVLQAARDQALRDARADLESAQRAAEDAQHELAASRWVVRITMHACGAGMRAERR